MGLASLQACGKKTELIGPAQIHRFVKLRRSEEGKPQTVSCAALSSPRTPGIVKGNNPLSLVWFK